MIKIQPLPKGRFLLGFSGGVDSSALFFLLLEEGVEFDLAIIDYGLREQSKEEVRYAQSLAREFNKVCHYASAPQFKGNFESKAREFRYAFFSSLMGEYDGLILAHQLNDRIEWLLMQLFKGVGLNTLLGFEFSEKRGKMEIFRPLWKVKKEALYAYCHKKKIKYFEDESNANPQYQRNAVRKWASELIKEHALGISKSLEYLLDEKRALYGDRRVSVLGEIEAFERGQEGQNLHQIDQLLKQRGYVMSSKQREEIKRCGFSCEIGGKFVIASDAQKIYLSAQKKGKMTREFRDFARRLNIPKYLRKPLFFSQCSKEEIEEFFPPH